MAAVPLTPTPRRRLTILGIVLVALLGIGAVVAGQVGAALGLSFTPARVPSEDLHPAAIRSAVPPPLVGAVAVPDDDPRLKLAASAVTDALKQQDVTGSGTLSVKIDPAFPDAGESYRLTRTGNDYRLDAAGDAGAAAGLYQFADRVRSQADVGANGDIVTPTLGLRLVDTGAVGLDDDPSKFAAGTDYSLNTDVVGNAIRPTAPYVDTAAVQEINEQFRDLVDHSLAQGYNGIVIPGFLEYVTFGDLGVYPAGDLHVARARAMVAAFAPVWQYAHDMGMKVYFQTDMLALSPPLKAYLNRTVGGLNTDSAKLWQVYQDGLKELFTSMPFADGLMIRIGEGGDVYKMPGWDFSSEIAVTTPSAVQMMLTSLLQTAGMLNKDVIFRTWTVGVGAVGDLHTNKQSYETVLGTVNNPHLIVSTKYSLGDFYSHLPLNDTLEVGDQRRIIEFQGRREFEGLGSLPNDLGVLEQQALRTFLAANPHIEGVWDWTQNGGPLYAGPRSLYLRDGLWQLYDLNSYLTARLAMNPDLDPASATADWIRATLSTDLPTVTAISQVFAMSRTAISNGLYIGPYADNTVKALGLEPPPMMWIFEWDIITGDSAALDSIYKVSRGHIDEAIHEGVAASSTVAQMRSQVAGTDPAKWRDPELREEFLNTLDYEQRLFDTLGAYRTMVLRHVQWLDTGSATAKAEWKAAEARYQQARLGYLLNYENNLDLPTYNFTAADIGSVRADRDSAMAWSARALLALLVILLLLGSGPGRRIWPRRPRALQALWLGATRPWRVAGLDLGGRLDRVLVWAIPAAFLIASRAVYTWFAAPAHLILVLGSWLTFALTLKLLVRGRPAYWLWGAVGGAALLRTVILLLALINRGPGRYWFDFWTDPTLRSVYITVAFAAFIWVFVVAAVILRDRYGLIRRGSVGRILVALGLPLVVFGAIISAMGLERALTIWNDQMALLPWGLSRILGITVYLGIPTSLPLYALVFGAVLTLSGGLVMIGRGKPQAVA